MNVVHLTASTFHGGPERQMLGLARSLSPGDRTVFLSFAEGGRCRHFLSAVRKEGFEALGLGEGATATLLNGLNLLGGACLLINAVIRREIVWEVLEVYFVIVAVKGLAQARRRALAERLA